MNMWLAFFDEENMSTYYSEVKRLAETNSWIDGSYYQLQPMSQISQVFKGDSNEGLFEIAQNITTVRFLKQIICGVQKWYMKFIRRMLRLLHTVRFSETTLS